MKWFYCVVLVQFWFLVVCGQQQQAKDEYYNPIENPPFYTSPRFNPLVYSRDLPDHFPQNTFSSAPGNNENDGENPQYPYEGKTAFKRPVYRVPHQQLVNTKQPQSKNGYNNFQEYQLSSGETYDKFFPIYNPSADSLSISSNKLPTSFFTYLTNLFNQWWSTGSNVASFTPITTIITRPGFPWRTLRTVVTVTVSSTIMTPRIVACIPSGLFVNSLNPTSCLPPSNKQFLLRHNDGIAETKDEDIILPSAMLQPMEQTVLPRLSYPFTVENDQRMYEPEPSMIGYEMNEDYEASPINVGRFIGNERMAKRYFDVIKTKYATVTALVVEPVKSSVTIMPVSPPINNNLPGVMLCIPPGVSVCQPN